MFSSHVKGILGIDFDYTLEIISGANTVYNKRSPKMSSLKLFDKG